MSGFCQECRNHTCGDVAKWATAWDTANKDRDQLRAEVETLKAVGGRHQSVIQGLTDEVGRLQVAVQDRAEEFGEMVSKLKSTELQNSVQKKALEFFRDTHAGFISGKVQEIARKALEEAPSLHKNEIEKLELQVRDLKENLRKYGAHTRDCDVNYSGSKSLHGPKPCDCGWEGVHV